jgi:hypothetical protein
MRAMMLESPRTPLVMREQPAHTRAYVSQKSTPAGGCSRYSREHRILTCASAQAAPKGRLSVNL